MAFHAKGAVAAAADPLGPGGRERAAVPLQLLSPEGERVEHPDYPLEVSAAEVQALYRDLVLVRRIGPAAGDASRGPIPAARPNQFS